MQWWAESVGDGLRRALDEAAQTLPEPGRTAVARLRKHPRALECVKEALVRSNAMPYHDAWKLLSHIATAYEMALSADTLSDERRRFADAHTLLLQAADGLATAAKPLSLEIRRMADLVAKEADRRGIGDLMVQPVRRLAPEYRRLFPHTIFISLLAGAVEADWLDGVIGDRSIALITTAVFDLKRDVDPAVVDMIRRRARK